MEVGRCSCIQGVTGSECKHQAAVAKHYSIYSVNIPPFFSKSARQVFAILAVGESKVLELDFYADLRDTEVVPVPILESSGNNDNYHQYSDIPSPTLLTTDHTNQPQEEWSEVVSIYKTKLTGIIDDLVQRLETGDQNIASGVKSS